MSLHSFCHKVVHRTVFTEGEGADSFCTGNCAQFFIVKLVTLNKIKVCETTLHF